jgi:predicted enzyme related to lactoylglutathione lyase
MSSIVHIEVAAADPAATSAFYQELFGWKITAQPFDGGMVYHMFESQPNLGGGFPQVGSGPNGESGFKPGDIVFYVATDDIEASLAKAEALGGRTLLGKTEIPGMGWFAHFADPTGNRIGLFSMGTPPA